jgi:hypothetical protein
MFLVMSCLTVTPEVFRRTGETELLQILSLSWQAQTSEDTDVSCNELFEGYTRGFLGEPESYHS